MEEDWAMVGNSRALEALRELIIFPFLYAKESQKLGLKWPRGLLLYGAPGTGKTRLVEAVVGECNAHLTMIKACSVHRAHVGESEQLLRDKFAEAASHTSTTGKPSVVFIDEIDAICPRRNNRKEQESRIVGQLLTLMDGSRISSKSLPHVVVVASTSRVDGIDPALRRPGRFDSEIEVTVPTAEERLQILRLLLSKHHHLGHDDDLLAIAASCNGYVGADLEALYREAVISAFHRLPDAAKSDSLVELVMEDWECARTVVGPSITRGVTKELRKVTWDDIGGLRDLKKKLKQAVEWPIKHPDAFARLGISPLRGVLLHGPPGCSKTSIALAAAHAAQASFFSLSGAELYAKYVGEGEELLRKTFKKARFAAPSILFFDEADAIAPKRGHGGDSSGNVTVGERLLSTLLTEMDGLEEATGITVLAATNRPQAIDAALLRPGRFDLVLYVPPPDAEGRYEILRIHTRKMSLGEDVDLMRVAECTDLFTGADLEGLCREAGMLALREDISGNAVFNRHFQAARDSRGPSLTESKIEEYSQKFIRYHGHDTRFGGISFPAIISLRNFTVATVLIYTVVFCYAILHRLY